jgi:hypothetical protein
VRIPSLSLGYGQIEEEDWDFLRLFPIISDLLRLFATQPANATSPKSKKQPKISLIKNAIARLLLLSRNKKFQINYFTLLKSSFNDRVFTFIAK